MPRAKSAPRELLMPDYAYMIISPGMLLLMRMFSFSRDIYCFLHRRQGDCASSAAFNAVSHATGLQGVCITVIINTWYRFLTNALRAEVSSRTHCHANLNAIDAYAKSVSISLRREGDMACLRHYQLLYSDDINIWACWRFSCCYACSRYSACLICVEYIASRFQV